VPFFSTPTPEDLGSDQGLFLAQLREIAMHGEKDSDRIAAASAGLRAIAHIQTLDQRARRLDQRDRDFQLAERYLDLSERREARMASRPTRAATSDHAADPYTTDYAAPADPEPEPQPEPAVALTLDEFEQLRKYLPNLDRKYLQFRNAGPYWRRALREYQAEEAAEAAEAAQAAELVAESANTPSDTNDISPTSASSPSTTAASPASAPSPHPPGSSAPSLPTPESRRTDPSGEVPPRAEHAIPQLTSAPTDPPIPIANNRIPTPRPSPIHHSGP
jgi:hypothetical protein